MNLNKVKRIVKLCEEISLLEKLNKELNEKKKEIEEQIKLNEEAIKLYNRRLEYS
jgi:hypothetical protein